MSTAIHNCPNCSSVIIADTDECPECGHVLDQSKAEKAVLHDDMKPTRLRESPKEGCPHCGEGVPVGLLRCWKCNGFMRQEIEDRFNEMATNPQPIIYSSIPPDQRTELLPARASRVRRQDDDGDFTLADGVVSRRSETPQDDVRTQSPANAEALANSLLNPDSPDAPEAKTPGRTSRRIVADAVTDEESAASEETSETKAKPGKQQSSEESDLLQIALDEQRDAQQRRRDRRAERTRKTMLLPCSCGAWIRVQDSLAGMVVRCRQCRSPIQVPVIRRRANERRKTETTAEVQITWIDDVWFHVLTPTSVVLKPGSAEKSHTEADIALTESGISIVSLDSGAKKKSLLSFGGGGSSKVDTRKNIRSQIAEKGSLTELSNCEVRTIDVASITDLRLVQPVARVQESMFAGVPIFGEGRVAVFLPLEQQDGQQLYCSFSLSGWRQFAYGLNRLFDVTLPATENGVPAEDKPRSSNCFIKQSRVEFVANLNFYQNDTSYELELTGFQCTACKAVISEEGRASKKLGGAAGKGIAKAKCPKCNARMGEDKLFRISRAPAPPGADDTEE